MKKLSILMIAIVAATMAFAQPAKGDIYLGGDMNLGFGSSKNETGNTSTEGAKTFNFGISPKVGYFISDKVVVGLDLGFNTRSSKIGEGTTTDPQSKVSSTIIDAGVFARYYVMPVEKMGFFFEGGLGVGFGNENDKTEAGSVTNEYKTKLNTLDIGVSPGIAIYISKKVALEAQYGFIGYSALTETDDNDPNLEIKDKTGGFGLNVNPGTFKFGVSVLF